MLIALAQQTTRNSMCIVRAVDRVLIHRNPIDIVVVVVVIAVARIFALPIIAMIVARCVAPCRIMVVARRHCFYCLLASTKYYCYYLCRLSLLLHKTIWSLQRDVLGPVSNRC